ncbi:NAD(P)-dependent oxidoreductase [Actinophytocola algeriensis]|uniref:Phosphoglycerate dehydrogenase-like enzyme n=1 Tax=Actinophytocola algeriensis TaxID=1768010 RepID=A0A7W7VF20_9PSEU|nr:NAD(P)-dependent oxidoreductase [Actinophytocola algeriensis]MBB4907560.1 phosphoglycerate dehydrogenase-like enzyme [Actinophytocola algeriensis]MBE1479590.1 phosphoglycerate dehydrogenase-like enzyme [Actinophytocola algeriensis]
MLCGLYVMEPRWFDDVYGPAERASIERHLDIATPPLAAAGLTPDLLADVNVLVTGWGAPRLDAELLAAAPKLRLVLYGAGSVRPVVTADSWARGVRITCGAVANAEAVAEFALSQILYALKHGWRYVLESRRAGRAVPRRDGEGVAGALVGLTSLGAAGRATAVLLARHGVRLQAYDPHVDPAVAAALGVRLVDERALVDVLRRRPDLFAVLDVTDPEPPPPGSPLFSLPNVVVTPHLAGSLGLECRRMGQAMADELDRYVRGEPLRYEVFESAMDTTA